MKANSLLFGISASFRLLCQTTVRRAVDPSSATQMCKCLITLRMMTSALLSLIIAAVVKATCRSSGRERHFPDTSASLLSSIAVKSGTVVGIRRELSAKI
eukprot:scaffold7092_cov262-Pinguiococcus_pyrenoidosus.AAC.7